MLFAAAKEIVDDCSKSKEAQKDFDELGNCIWRKHEERQILPRAALLVPSDNIAFEVPYGCIIKEVFSPFGLAVTYLLLPNFHK